MHNRPNFQRKQSEICLGDTQWTSYNKNGTIHNMFDGVRLGKN